MAVRGALSTISGLIWEIDNSVGQGNFSLSGKSQRISKPMAVATMF